MPEPPEARLCRPEPPADYPLIPAKTLVTRTKSTAWFGSDYNMNIYRGCTHGCIYCDSRSDCYRNPDFDTVKVKADALRIIRDDLRRKVKTGVVATGAMSDPYNPLEARLELTRHALELIAAYGFGVAIATKSTLVLRDVDILREIARHAPVIVKITVTEADDRRARLIEPLAPAPSERLAAVGELRAAGLFAGILMMPVLPFISDNPENVDALTAAAGKNRANFIYPYFGLTMRDSQRAYFYSRLDEIYPGLREKYTRRYGMRYQCPSPNAGALYMRLAARCAERGILVSMRDIIRASRLGYAAPQISFFES